MNAVTSNSPTINSVPIGELKNTLPSPEQTSEKLKIIGDDRSVAPSTIKGTLIDTQI